MHDPRICHGQIRIEGVNAVGQDAQLRSTNGWSRKAKADPSLIADG